MQPWEDALALCATVLDILPDLPERAGHFRDEIQATVERFADWIADREHVTDDQVKALQNMKHGCEAWLCPF